MAAPRPLLLSLLLGLLSLMSVVRGQGDNPKLQSRSYILTRGNFSQFVTKFEDPWLVHVAPTGKLFDPRVREMVKLTAHRFRGLVKVGLFFVASADDALLRKFASIGFPETGQDWILCLPFGKDKNDSSSFLSVNRAFRRCIKSIPSTVHVATGTKDLNQLTFDGVVKHSPSRFVFLSITAQEIPILRVAAQRYKKYFLFARMDPAMFTDDVAATYSIARSANTTGDLFLLFMERQPGSGFVKRSVALGRADRVPDYPDLMELLFQTNAHHRRRLPGHHLSEDACDPHRFMVGVLAQEKRWFPRLAAAIDSTLGCGALVRRKLDSMSVPAPRGRVEL